MKDIPTFQFDCSLDTIFEKVGEELGLKISEDSSDDSILLEFHLPVPQYIAYAHVGEKDGTTTIMFGAPRPDALQIIRRAFSGIGATDEFLEEMEKAGPLKFWDRQRLRVYKKRFCLE